MLRIPRYIPPSWDGHSVEPDSLGGILNGLPALTKLFGSLFLLSLLLGFHHSKNGMEASLGLPFLLRCRFVPPPFWSYYIN